MRLLLRQDTFFSPTAFFWKRAINKSWISLCKPGGQVRRADSGPCRAADGPGGSEADVAARLIRLGAADGVGSARCGWQGGGCTVLLQPADAESHARTRTHTHTHRPTDPRPTPVRTRTHTIYARPTHLSTRLPRSSTAEPFKFTAFDVPWLPGQCGPVALPAAWSTLRLMPGGGRSDARWRRGRSSDAVCGVAARRCR